MEKYCFSILFTVLLNINAFSQQDTLAASLKNMEWLLGTWSGQSAGWNLVESWTKKNDEQFEGTGYFMNAQGDTVTRERLLIQKIGKHVVYIAIVGNNRPVLFTLAKVNEERQWVFENTEHDFPQRIFYALRQDGVLYARVEGKIRGKLQGEDYFLKKTE